MDKKKPFKTETAHTSFSSHPSVLILFALRKLRCPGTSGKTDHTGACSDSPRRIRRSIDRRLPTRAFRTRGGDRGGDRAKETQCILPLLCNARHKVSRVEARRVWVKNWTTLFVGGPFSAASGVGTSKPNDPCLEKRIKAALATSSYSQNMFLS